MGQALYVERETYPSVIPGEEVMFIFREHGTPSADARLFVQALDPSTSYRILSGRGPQVENYTEISSTVSLSSRGERHTNTLPQGGDHLDNVSVLQCLSGRLAVTVVSPHRVQMQFRTRERRTV